MDQRCFSISDFIKSYNEERDKGCFFEVDINYS